MALTSAGLASGGLHLPGLWAARPKNATPNATASEASDLEFLTQLARATLGKARVRPGETRGNMPPNSQRANLITPGGNYPAFWVRDFAMSLDCGLIPPQEILPHLQLLARCQNDGRERRLGSGAIIPPYAIPDHINFDGGAVFYPGTYSSGEDQGRDPWGPLPPIDDHYYFIHIAYALWRQGQDAAFLDERTRDLTLFDKLIHAFDAPAADARTGMAVTTRERRAVGFGFQDSVYLLGSLSFTSLLRYRAALQLAAICRETGRSGKASRFLATADRIAAHVVEVFAKPERIDGWLLAATEVGRQPDVWATLFALHLGILPKGAADRARKTVAAAVKAPGNTVEYQGGVRHVPSNQYFRPDRCWESGGGAVNTYQSGAFWHTPTGWLIKALRPVEPELARAAEQRYFQHLRNGDFRTGANHGAPWECFGIAMANAQNPVYLTSVTLPLAVLSGTTLGTERR